MLVIFDIDGTIADCQHRIPHIRPDPSHDPVTGKKKFRDFNRFHRECVFDTPIDAVVDIYKRYVNDPNVTVVLLTGRPLSARDATVEWFEKHGLTGYDQLFTKGQGEDYLPDVEFKAGIAAQVQQQYGKPIDMVFEDRARVVAMWKDMGIFCVNVDQHGAD